MNTGVSVLSMLDRAWLFSSMNEHLVCLEVEYWRNVLSHTTTRDVYYQARMASVKVRHQFLFDGVSALIPVLSGHKLMEDPTIAIDFAPVTQFSIPNSQDSASDRSLYQNAGALSSMLSTGADIMGHRKSALERLGKSRRFLESLLVLGAATSEVSHTVVAHRPFSRLASIGASRCKGGTCSCQRGS
jgi:hypothetical protein